MGTVRVPVDVAQALSDEPSTGHNRWHPDITPIAGCCSGDVLVTSTRDAADGQLRPGSGAGDVLGVDLGRVHPLTGPFDVEGARPGDVLELEIRSISPAGFGYTAVIPHFGFLRDLFDEPYLVRWSLADGLATSPDIPGVRLPAAPFLGIVGVAPDVDLVARSVVAESAAVARGDFAMPPTESRSAIPSTNSGRQGLRTGPPRANGGNIDVRHIRAGSRVFLPVLVDGARFSIGDAHFSQGDGEVCGLAVETCADVELSVHLHPGAARAHGIGPMRIEVADPAPARPSSRVFVTTGLSIDAAGASRSEDTTLAARNALLDMLDYLETRGLSRLQAYALCSAAVDLQISQVVDVPHAAVAAVLPLDIFDAPT